MASIPAASIHGVDLDRIRQHEPEKAVEIERIGRLLLAGEETDEEFRFLCQLLLEVGETSKAEDLLRSTARVGSPEHSLYLELFGRDAEEKFNEALHAFERQFGARLRPLEVSEDVSSIFAPQYLSSTFASDPATKPSELSERLPEVLSREFHVQISYNSPSEIIADVNILAEYGDPLFTVAVPLEYRDGRWNYSPYEAG